MCVCMCVCVSICVRDEDRDDYVYLFDCARCFHLSVCLGAFSLSSIQTITVNNTDCQYNTALNGGGGILYWDPTTISVNLTFWVYNIVNQNGNTALYGNTIATKEIKVIQTVYTSDYFSLPAATFTLPLTYTLLDYHDQVVMKSGTNGRVRL